MAKIKEDCFAWDAKECKGKALKATYCAIDGVCNFYKTKEQVQKELEGRRK